MSSQHILIADGHPLVRAYLARIRTEIYSTATLTVVANGVEALSALRDQAGVRRHTWQTLATRSRNVPS
jgi:hypothetical protein